jgi:glycosyltransferase involved in cell wall biosynthesis
MGMNIGFVCHEYPPAPHGGLGVFVKTMAEALAQRGHKVVVAGLYPKTTLPMTAEENSVTVMRFPVPRRGGRASFLVQRWQLARTMHQLVRQENLEIIEVPEGGGWSIFFNSACPVVVRLHSLTPFFYRQFGRRRGRLTNLAENLALRRADKISAVSRFVAREAIGLYPWARLTAKNIEVIYNGIDDQFFSQVLYSQRVPGRIVFAGTVKPMKGVETLLKAFAQVALHLREASLSIYGKDTLIHGSSYLDSILTPLNFTPEILARLHYDGPLPAQDMPSAYASASVCVFPSFAESFGLVAGEAMSCARPVIYTRLTAGPELIEDGVSGFLCDPSDPDELAHIIMNVLTRPQQAELVGLAAASRVRTHFSLQLCVEKTLEFYKSNVD